MEITVRYLNFDYIRIIGSLVLHRPQDMSLSAHHIVPSLRSRSVAFLGCANAPECLASGVVPTSPCLYSLREQVRWHMASLAF